MKILFAFFGILFFLSCNNSGITKPDNLINENVMEDILYDLSILEAVRAQIQEGDQKFTGKLDVYIYKKYKIDSLQFAKSNQYYAADVEEYKKIFDNIKQRMVTENEKLMPKIETKNNDSIK